jgi:hypothetical protein
VGDLHVSHERRAASRGVRTDVGVKEAVLAWGDGVWILRQLAMRFTIAMVASPVTASRMS